MEHYNKQFISVNTDLSIEIHCNPNISFRSYLLKIFSYNGYTEHRLDQTDMLNLAESIADFAFDNPDNAAYNGSYTGLCRLWHHRRNEALDTIEKLQTKLDYYESDNANR